MTEATIIRIDVDRPVEGPVEPYCPFVTHVLSPHALVCGGWAVCSVCGAVVWVDRD